MTRPKTTDEIQAEIASLKTCKAYIPRTNAFGDDNHRKIDLQIEELETGIDDTADEWNEFSEDEQSAILEARNWAGGDADESPSAGWDNYKP